MNVLDGAQSFLVVLAKCVWCPLHWSSPGGPTNTVYVGVLDDYEGGDGHWEGIAGQCLCTLHLLCVEVCSPQGQEACVLMSTWPKGGSRPPWGG